jgi:hypothetical protein
MPTDLSYFIPFPGEIQCPFAPESASERIKLQTINAPKRLKDIFTTEAQSSQRKPLFLILSGDTGRIKGYASG